MKSRRLSKSAIKFLNQDLFQEYGIEPLTKKDIVLEIEKEEMKYFKVNDDISFFYNEDEVLIPTLKNLLKNNFLKNVTVDMGAVKFVASGADIMRPGVVEIDEKIHEGELVTIIDVNNKKPLAIGRALMDSDGMNNADSGKCIESVHHIGDKIWNLE